MDSIIASVNRTLQHLSVVASLQLWSSETAYPGLHAEGPQGLIDQQLRIEDSDLFIAVFWKRFGTPVGDAGSGTAHEILRAIEAWKSKRTPEVMLYFRETTDEPTSPGENDQFLKLQAFKQDLLSTEKPFVRYYKDPAEFRSLLTEHLIVVATILAQRRDQKTAPYSPFRFSAIVDKVHVRREGLVELVGDIFLRCTYVGDRPQSSLVFDVVLSASTPITSRMIGPAVAGVTLFEVGRPGATVLVSGEGRHYSNKVVFRDIRLNDISPNETRTFQICNLRCAGTHAGYADKSAALAAGRGENVVGNIWAHVTVTGATVEGASLIVASVTKGLDFEVRTPDNSQRLPEPRFEASQSANLVDMRVATLRFTEGFPNAFKPRGTSPGQVKNASAVYTGESSPLCQVVDVGGGNIDILGLADNGTRLQACFRVQAGTRILVSVSNIGYAQVRIIEAESNLVPGTAMKIGGFGGLEVRELLIDHSGSHIVWEVLAPVSSGSSLGELDFAVFASYMCNEPTNPGPLPMIWVVGGFAPSTSTGVAWRFPEFIQLPPFGSSSP